MNYKTSESTDIESLVFSPKWYAHKITKDANYSFEACAWIIFETQSYLVKEITSCFKNDNIFLLTANNSKDILLTIKSRNISRVIFIARTHWLSGIDNNNICNFLDLIKQMQVGFEKVVFDVVTIKSIICPVYGTPTNPIDSVFIGLIQTLANESNATIRSFILDKLSYNNLESVLSGIFSVPLGHPIVIANNNYWYSCLEPAHLTEHQSSSEMAFRPCGTYMIIGANGGLGGLLAKYLAKNYRANLILVGRSAHNLQLVAELKELGANSVCYEKTNIEDFTQLNNTLSQYDSINGIIHSALLLHDSLIINMSRDSLLKVLGPKVHGVVNLINSLKSLKSLRVDFVLFFSSIQSYIANPGQANYTAACVAKDALASMLSEMYMINTKIINWGYWGKIGIVASNDYRRRMERLGIGSIEEEGVSIICKNQALS